MAFLLNRGQSEHGDLAGADGAAAREQVGFREASADCLEIGLVNNMPDAALEATERQFVRLIGSAAEGLQVRITLLSLADVPRSERGRRHLEHSYFDISDLWDSRLDGLIVTGTEPRTATLREEPYWRALTALVGWARAEREAFRCVRLHQDIEPPFDERRSALPADAALARQRIACG